MQEITAMSDPRDLMRQTRRTPQGEDLWSPQICDLVRDTSTGDRLRVTGFYARREITRGGRPPMAYLLPCMAADPAMSVVGTYGVMGQFHRPFELEWDGQVAWSLEMIQFEIARWDKEVGDLADALNEKWYPDLLARFPSPSNHQKIIIQNWRTEVDQKIREALTGG